MRPHHIALGFAALTLTAHLLVAGQYEPHRDELLYLALGRHLHWGYASVPPMIGWLGALADALWANPVWGAKLWAALGGAAVAVVVGAIVQTLGGGRWATLAACAAVVFSPAYVATSALFQPVIFDILLWTLSIWLFLRLLLSEDTRWWIPLGAVWGLGMMTKYNIAFLIAAAGLALLATPARRLLFSRHLLWGALAGLAIWSPNLYWQYQEGFPVIHHMRELSRTQLVHVDALDFLLNQLLMNGHAAWFWLFALAAVWIYPGERRLRPLAVLFVAAIGLYLLGRGKAYYTLGLYPALMAAGAVMAERYWRRAYAWAALAFTVLLALPLAPIGLPVFSHDRMAGYFAALSGVIGTGFLTWETGEVHPITQDYADMTGWQEMTDLVALAYSRLSDDEKRQCVVSAENYGQASAIAILGRERGLPEPICFSDNYLYWLPDSLSFKALIRMNDEESDVHDLFGRVELVGEVRNPWARERGLMVWICRDPIPGFGAFYQNRLKTRRAERMPQ